MKSMVGTFKMGFVRSMHTTRDYTKWEGPTFELADVECDDGSRVQVDPKDLAIGDRVEVTYQGFRYDVRKLLF